LSVIDGQPVNQSVTNAAFLSKNTNDTMPNILGFARALSGASIADIQAAVNKLYNATGASETQTGTVYNATAGTITNGQSYQTALTELAGKFDPATGHYHTGAPGDGPLLPVVSSIAATGFTPLTGAVTLVGLNGIALNESAHTISISNDLSFTTPLPVAATGSVGSSVFSAREDHVHEGLHSIAASGNAQITGDAVLVAGSNVSLSQLGSQIFISASGGGGGGGGSGPITTLNYSTGSNVVAASSSLFWPYLTISVADTFIIPSTSELVSVSSMIVNGTLINNGVTRVL
jgi:hypothetical protein